MDRQELTDIVVNSAIGAKTLSFLTDFILKTVKNANKYTDKRAQQKYNNFADFYVQLLENYYTDSEKDPSIEANHNSLQIIQQHLVYIHDIEVEGIISPGSIKKVETLKRYSLYGSILTATLPFFWVTGVVGLTSLVVYGSARALENQIRHFMAELKAAADEMAPKRDALKDIELPELHEALQESRERVQQVLHPPVNETPLCRRRIREGVSNGYNPYRAPGWF